MKAVVTKPFSEEHLSEFTGIEGYDFSYEAEISDETLETSDVILGQPSPARLAGAKKLKMLQITSAGTDAYTRNADIFPKTAAFCNLSGAFGQSISEFVLTYVFMLYKHLHLFRDHQNRHEWVDEGRQDSPVGKNLLILGAGNIGTCVARLFRPFNCRITGMRRSKAVVPPEYDAIITMDELDPALEKADIVVCALPGTKETEKLFDSRRLSLLKPTALLVNVGRGSLIDGLALADALDSGTIAGAAIDVTDPEPLPADHPLWACRNCILTPHITGGSLGHLKATEEVMFDICRKNLARLRDGEPLLNLVDFSTGYRVNDNRY